MKRSETRDPSHAAGGTGRAAASPSPADTESPADEEGLLNRHGVDYEGKRLWCAWPWTTAVLTCDGTVVCGCGDAFNENPMGDAGTRTMREIWQGEGFQRMRRGMLGNGPIPFCFRCGLMEVHPGGHRTPDWPPVPATYPETLYVEPTILCNLRCPQPCCTPERLYPTRKQKLLPFELFAKVIDEVGPDLRRMIFYNYGESFIHPDACRMIRYAKEKNPATWVWTTTNGHHFDTPEKVREIVESGVDEIQFSIDGATQEVYERYRRRGSLAQVLDAIRAIIEERERRGTIRPIINWNYILFDWNDSDEEMERARRLAIEVGVDRLTWCTTDQPPHAPSRKFRPASPPEHRLRIRTGLADGGEKKPNAIRWRARIEPLELPGGARIGGPIQARFRVTNEGDTTWLPPEGNPVRKIFLGAHLLEPDGTIAHECFLQAGVTRPIPPGESEEIELRGRAPGPPGGLFRLEVDVMRTGIFWFKEGGGEPFVTDFEITGPEASRRWIELLDPPQAVDRSREFEIRVRVRNSSGYTLDGTEPLPGRPGIGIRWARASDGEIIRDGERVYFSPGLRPDETRDLTIRVPAEALPAGIYRAKIDVIKEFRFWFENLGFEPALLDIVVKNGA